MYRVGLNDLRRRFRRSALETRLLGRQHPTAQVPAAAAEIWDVVCALPRRQRTAVVLRYAADLPEQDVARIMGIQRGTVSATLRSALRNLGPLVRDDPDNNCPIEVRHA